MLAMGMKLYRREITTELLDIVFYSRYPLTDRFAEDLTLEFIRFKDSFMYEVNKKHNKAQYIVYI